MPPATTTPAPNPASTRPWLHAPASDILFIIAPAFLATAAVLAFPSIFAAQDALSPAAWLILIAFIDVAHVYSTLWRTYLDPLERKRHGTLLWAIPLAAWIAGAALHAIGGLLFWRVMAYLAVFHFIRQQYGFMALYARHQGRAAWERHLDAATIYAATIHPLIHWHTHMPRPFHWFIEGDFITLQLPWISTLAGILYAALLITYLAKEALLSAQGRPFNLPKNLILAGTAISWHIGIVQAQADLAFTATNVIAHGIPYMALVWMYQRKKAAAQPPAAQRQGIHKYFRIQMLPIFIGLLLLLAYLEEGLWDALIWRDHQGLFPWAAQLPQLSQGWAFTILVPLLAVPQATHYILDGFIWKLRRQDGDLRKLDQP